MPVNLLDKLERESGDIIAELRNHLELVLEGFVGGSLDSAPVSKILSHAKYHDVVTNYRPILHGAFIRFLSALLYALKTSSVEVSSINDRAYDLSAAHEHLKNTVNLLKSDVSKFIREVTEEPSVKEKLSKDETLSYENMLAISVINKLVLSSLDGKPSPVRRISSDDFSSYESTTTLTVFCDEKKSKSWDLQVGDNLETDADRIKKYCASASAVPFPEYGVDIVDEWWASNTTSRQQQSTPGTTKDHQNVSKTSVDSDQSASTSSSSAGVASESEQDCVDGTSNGRHHVMASTEWEDNWLFRKKPRTKTEVFNYEPVQMVIPKPKEKGAVTLGSVDIDACSELSENNSIASLDFSSSEDDEDKPQVTGAVMKSSSGSEDLQAEMVDQVSKDPIISKLVDKKPSVKCDSVSTTYMKTPSACVSVTSNQDLSSNSILVQQSSINDVAVNEKGATIVTLNVKHVNGNDSSTARILVEKPVKKMATPETMASSGSSQDVKITKLPPSGATAIKQVNTNLNAAITTPSAKNQLATVLDSESTNVKHDINQISNTIQEEKTSKLNQEKNTAKMKSNEISIDRPRLSPQIEETPAVAVNTIGQIRITSSEDEIKNTESTEVLTKSSLDQRHDLVINGRPYCESKIEKNKIIDSGNVAGSNTNNKLTGFRAKASYDGRVVVEDITQSSRIEARSSIFGNRRDSRGTPEMERTTPLGDSTVIYEERQSEFHEEERSLQTFELINERRDTFGSNSLRSSTSEEDLELHASVSTDYSLRRSPEGCSASAEPHSSDTPAIVRKYMGKGSPDEQDSTHSQDHGIDVTDSSLFKKNIGKNNEHFDDKMKENDLIVNSSDVKGDHGIDRPGRTVKISVCSSGLGSLSSLLTTPSPIDDLRQSSPEEMKQGINDTPEPPAKIERLLLTISGEHRSTQSQTNNTSSSVPAASNKVDNNNSSITNVTSDSGKPIVNEGKTQRAYNIRDESQQLLSEVDQKLIDAEQTRNCDVIDHGLNDVNKPGKESNIDNNIEELSLRKLRQQQYAATKQKNVDESCIADKIADNVEPLEKIEVITRPKPQPRTTILEQKKKNISKSEQDLHKCQELDRDQEIYDVVAVKCEPIPKERRSLVSSSVNDDDVMERVERFQSSTLPNPKKKKNMVPSDKPTAAKRGLAKVSSISRKVDPFSGSSSSSSLIDTIPAPPSNRRNFNQVFPSYEATPRTSSQLVRSSSVSCRPRSEVLTRGCDSQLEKDRDDYIPVVPVRGKNFGVQIYPAVPEEVPQTRYDRVNVGAFKDFGSEVDLAKKSTGMRQVKQLSRAQSVRDVHVAPMKKNVIEEEIQGKLPSVKRLASRFLAEDSSWTHSAGPGGYQSVTLPTPGRQKRMQKERQKAKKEDEVHRRLSTFDSFT